MCPDSRGGDRCNNTQVGLGRPGPVGMPTLSGAVPLGRLASKQVRPMAEDRELGGA